VLAETVDFARLARAPIKLFVTATNVHTGQGRVFRNAEVTPDTLAIARARCGPGCGCTGSAAT
jgi:predicted acylesterase/phospholipase RssA